MLSPIFVVGKNRSGTKWLSNIIANHPEVASVQREEAGGILESNVISTMPQIFGDLSIDENYYGFVSCFSQTNFFRLTGLSESVLFSKEKCDYYQFFRWLMDKYTENQRKERWVQKASIDKLPVLLRAYPEARFIIIEREIVANILSSFGLRLLQGEHPPGLFREMCKYYHSAKTARRFAHDRRVMTIRFEQLKTHRGEVIRKVCNFLGLEFTEMMLEDRFGKNTSFVKGIERDRILSANQIRFIRFFSPVLNTVPLGVFNCIQKLFGRRSKSRFVSNSFVLLKREYCDCEKDD